MSTNQPNLELDLLVLHCCGNATSMLTDVMQFEMQSAEHCTLFRCLPHWHGELYQIGEHAASNQQPDKQANFDAAAMQHTHGAKATQTAKNPPRPVCYVAVLRDAPDLPHWRSGD
jgi:hypothetical protein